MRQGVAQYLTLVQDRGHVDGTLGMMAQWRLDRLMARLPQMTVPTLLIATAGDRIVPPGCRAQAAADAAAARICWSCRASAIWRMRKTQARCAGDPGWLAR